MLGLWRGHQQSLAISHLVGRSPYAFELPLIYSYRFWKGVQPGPGLGSNFAPTLSDDPDTPEAQDPTETPLSQFF